MKTLSRGLTPVQSGALWTRPDILAISESIPWKRVISRKGASAKAAERVERKKTRRMKKEQAETRAVAEFRA